MRPCAEQEPGVASRNLAPDTLGCGSTRLGRLTSSPPPARTTSPDHEPPRTTAPQTKKPRVPARAGDRGGRRARRLRGRDRRGRGRRLGARCRALGAEPVQEADDQPRLAVTGVRLRRHLAGLHLLARRQRQADLRRGSEAGPSGDDRDRGPSLLPARRVGLRGHHPSRVQGHRARLDRAAGRLDPDRAGGRQRLPAQEHRQGPQGAQPQVQDRAGQARAAARAEALQALDPDQVPERGAVRNRRRRDRLRDRRRRPDVLRQAGCEAADRPGGDARRLAAGTEHVQPVPAPRGRPRASKPGAAGDGDRGRHHASARRTSSPAGR